MVQTKWKKMGSEKLEGKTLWFVAMRWRRAVEVVLGDAELSFKEWLVLDAADELIRETHDAVSQNDVCQRAELEKMAVSRAMTSLDGRGLVSRDAAFESSAYRVFLTGKGKSVLARVRRGITQIGRINVITPHHPTGKSAAR